MDSHHAAEDTDEETNHAEDNARNDVHLGGHELEVGSLVAHKAEVRWGAGYTYKKMQ